jgi:hypothetical protein
MRVQRRIRSLAGPAEPRMAVRAWRPILVTLVIAGVCLGDGLPQARAGFIRAKGTTSAIGGVSSFDDTGLVPSGSAEAEAQSLGIVGGTLQNTASAFGLANYGTLSSFAYATSTNVNPLAQGAVAGGEAMFSDLLRVRSDSLSFGTPVVLRFSQLVIGSFHAGTDGLALASVDSGLSLNTGQFTTYSAGAGVTGSGYSESVTDSGPLFVNMTVGTAFRLDGLLRTNAIVGTTNAVWSDYSNTAHYYADPVTPGVYLTSDSGHDYSSPGASPAVPEPASLSLAGLGLLSLFGYGWRHRRRGGALRRHAPDPAPAVRIGNQRR